jgi:hypothetical protein
LVERRAAFLRNDGKIVDLDGISNVPFPSLSEGFYYLIVKHRNHLGVMSKTPAYYNNNHFEYDFRLLGSAYGFSPMADLSNGMCGLRSGDGNSSGSVTASDNNLVWRPQNGTLGYLQGDFNLTGSVTASDANLHWRVNNGVLTQIPN